MRVFVTGATGFIGTAVVKELITNGHQVLGLTRSEGGAKALQAAGAEALHGSLESLDSLKRGAAAADAVIHLAFIHDFSKFQENCEIDKRAIEAMGSVLKDTHKPLIVTGGLAGVGAPGSLATEKDTIPADHPFPRVSEQTALALKGVNASAMRLPQVHDTQKQGLVSYIIPMMRAKGVAAYVGDGSTRWAAAHISDVARLYRLALEKFEAGSVYHAVAEEGVSMKEMSEAIGRGLNIPVKSISPEEAPSHFGGMAMFVSLPIVASSAITQKKYGWKPTGPGIIADLNAMDYSAARAA